MCMVSYVGDLFQTTAPQWAMTGTWTIVPPPEVTQEEFAALKKQVEEIAKLLQAAKIYDEATGQKDCEHAEKISLLKQIAKKMGVELPI